MTRAFSNPTVIQWKLECFGCYDPHDTICLRWCQLNIRCAVARDHFQQQEVLEDLIDTVTTTTTVQ